MNRSGLLILAMICGLSAGCTLSSHRPTDPCLDVPGRLDALILRHQSLDRAYNSPAFDGEAERLAADYEKLRRDCPAHEHAAAVAARSIGNIRLSQGRLNDAVDWYHRVASDYPGESWEVMQSLKSAADALYDHGETGRAREFDQRLLATFAGPDLPRAMELIVGVVRERLQQGNEP